MVEFERRCPKCNCILVLNIYPSSVYATCNNQQCNYCSKSIVNKEGEYERLVDECLGLTRRSCQHKNSVRELHIKKDFVIRVIEENGMWIATTNLSVSSLIERNTDKRIAIGNLLCRLQALNYDCFRETHYIPRLEEKGKRYCKFKRKVISKLRKRYSGEWSFNTIEKCWKNSNGWNVRAYTIITPQFSGDTESYITIYRRTDTKEVVLPIKRFTPNIGFFWDDDIEEN